MRIFMPLLLILSAGCGDSDLSKSVRATDGAPGKDGASCTLSQDKQTLVCPNGSVKVSTVNSCSYSTNKDGAVVGRCPGQPDFVFPIPTTVNGIPGTPGTNGKDACAGNNFRLEVDAGQCLWYICGDTRKKIFDFKTNTPH